MRCACNSSLVESLRSFRFVIRAFYVGFMGCRALRQTAESVDRTQDAERSSVEDVGVNHRGCHILVAKKLLNGADVLTVLEQMRCERMTERVRTGRFPDAAGEKSFTERALQHRFVKVVAATFPALQIDVEACGGKHPLP